MSTPAQCTRIRIFTSPQALEPLGVVEAAVQAGIPAKAISISDRHSTLFSVDFMSLHPYTRHPYILVLPQQLLEGIFRDKLQSHSVRIFRPYRMIGMRESAQRGMAEVSFEGGAVMRARYVIGADGSHSTVYYYFRSHGTDVLSWCR